MTPANPTGIIAIPQWICSHELTLEELGIYTLLAAQHHYQETQPNPQHLATIAGCPQQKIKDLLNTLVAKGLLVKGTTTYQLQFGTLTPPGAMPASERPAPEHQAARTLVRELSNVMPELAKALGDSTDDIIPLVGETLDRGISPAQIRRAIGDRTLTGVDNTLKTITYRLRGLLPQRDETRRQPDCPLHRGQTWHHCHCCKGEINEGKDPYAGRETQRPDGWLSAYPDAWDLVDIEPVVESDPATTA